VKSITRPTFPPSNPQDCASLDEFFRARILEGPQSSSLRVLRFWAEREPELRYVMASSKKRPHHWHDVFRCHSLSLVTIGILILWIVLYRTANPSHRDGAFYGNAIADWSGSVVAILATKYFFERGSEESRPFKKHLRNPAWNWVYEHSLTLFLIVTGLLWLWLFLRLDPNSKWGQVVGNIVSEWLQMLGLLLMTKRLLERGSRESHWVRAAGK